MICDDFQVENNIETESHEVRTNEVIIRILPDPMVVQE